jgi:hypothetical protein
MSKVARRLCSLSVFVASSLCPGVAEAQGNGEAQAASPPSVVDVTRLTRGLYTGFEVSVKGLAESETLNEWVVYFDDAPIPEITPTAVTREPAEGDDGVTVFRFEFPPATASGPAWRSLFARASFIRQSRIGVGPAEKGTAVVALPVTFKLMMLPAVRLIFVAVAFAVVVWLVFRLGKRTPLLKEGGVYSLGRSQMAWWFLIVLAAYLFIGVVMGTWFGTIGGQALALMGISAATGLTAAAIGSDKWRQAQSAQEKVDAEAAQVALLEQAVKDPANAAKITELADQLSAARKALSEAKAKLVASKAGVKWTAGGFLSDIVSDPGGIALHRFQVVVWTVVIGSIFLMKVVTDLVMPEFDPTMLALMGISSGTYLGFKIPEKP